MGCSQSTKKNATSQPLEGHFEPSKKKGFPLSPQDFIIHKKSKFADDYEKIITIGKGAYGEVHKVEHKRTGLVRAVKILKKQHYTPEEEEQILAEAKILSELDHPRILKLYEIYEDMAFYYFVTEYLEGGEVLGALSKQMTFSEATAAKITKQVLQAINYCHIHKIVHRDIKLQNIMYEFDAKDSPVKIIDFGVAKHFDPKVPITEALGTPDYLAPEVINQKYNEKCDIWACGVLLYIMLNGTPPFHGRDNNETIQLIREGRLKLETMALNKVSAEGKNLIKRLLTIDPTKRPSAEEALKDPWFKIVDEKEELIEKHQDSLKNLKLSNSEEIGDKLLMLYIAAMQTSNSDRKMIDELFLFLDNNNDGSLDKNEIIKAKLGLKKLKGGDSLTENQIGSLIDQLDLKSSGKIDYSEFVAATLRQAQFLTEKKLKETFSVIDKDADESISIEDLKSIFIEKTAQSVSEEICKKWVAELDFDGDGKVTFSDFKAKLLQRGS